MAEDREIGGIRCMQVLERLDDYVADELPTEVRQKVEAHLTGCDWCTQFGGRYVELVTRLRTRLLLESPPEDAARTLAEKLLRSRESSSE